MGNPLHKLFKKLFTGSQDKKGKGTAEEITTERLVEDEAVKEINESLIEDSDKAVLDKEDSNEEILNEESLNKEGSKEEDLNKGDVDWVKKETENLIEDDNNREGEEESKEKSKEESEIGSEGIIEQEEKQPEKQKQEVGMMESQQGEIIRPEQEEAMETQQEEIIELQKEVAEEEIEEEGIAEVIEESLVVRELKEYIPNKVYEEKLIKYLEAEGITSTTQINRQVVALMLAYPGMTDHKGKGLLSKFKGYVPFSAVQKLFTREEWKALEHTIDWCVNINIYPVYAELKIKEVFKESFFEPLCKLAKIKEISKIGEITTAFLMSYKNYSGVGEKKYRKTLEILAQYAKKDKSLEVLGIEQSEEIQDEYAIELEPHLYDLLNNCTLGQVGMLYGKDIEGRVKAIKLKHLQGKSINEAVPLVNRPALEKSLAGLIHIVVPSKAFENLDNKAGLEVLKYRFEQGHSLEETAQKLNQTLEEVRKTQNQTLETLTEALRESRLVEVLTFFNKGDHHVAFKTVEDVVGKQNANIIGLIKHNAFHDLGYSSIFNMVFLNESIGEMELMEELSTKLPEAFQLNDYKKEIEMQIENIGIKKWGKDVIPNLLMAMGYHANEKFYSKHDVSSSYILDMIFRVKVKNPLYLDEDAIEFLGEEARKSYNYSLGNNMLVIEKDIRETKEILQVGSNVYLHSCRLKCKEEVLQAINEYLIELSKTQAKVNSNVVYKHFKEQLKGSNIQDQYGLYTIIYHYFGVNYKKEGEDSLNIILKEEKQNINNIIGLEQAAPRLQQLINKHMDSGYIKTQAFLEELIQRDELKDFLKTNHVEDYKIMAEILKLVDDTLLGEDDFLYRTNSLYRSMKELEAAGK